jgi:hypothetical protein
MLQIVGDTMTHGCLSSEQESGGAGSVKTRSAETGRPLGDAGAHRDMGAVVGSCTDTDKRVDLDVHAVVSSDTRTGTSADAVAHEDHVVRILAADASACAGEVAARAADADSAADADAAAAAGAGAARS